LFAVGTIATFVFAAGPDVLGMNCSRGIGTQTMEISAASQQSVKDSPDVSPNIQIELLTSVIRSAVPLF
jgi:hypothetical protein